MQYRMLLSRHFIILSARNLENRTDTATTFLVLMRNFKKLRADDYESVYRNLSKQCPPFMILLHSSGKYAVFVLKTKSVVNGQKSKTLPLNFRSRHPSSCPPPSLRLGA